MTSFKKFYFNFNKWKKAELEVQALQRRINLTETDFEQMENRLKEITAQLNAASHAAEESERWLKCFIFFLF